MRFTQSMTSAHIPAIRILFHPMLRDLKAIVVRHRGYKPQPNLGKAVATIQAKRLFPKVSCLKALGNPFFLRTRNFSVCRMTFLLDFGVRQATFATCPDVPVFALPGGVPFCEHRPVRSTLAFVRVSRSGLLARDTVSVMPLLRFEILLPVHGKLDTRQPLPQLLRGRCSVCRVGSLQ